MRISGHETRSVFDRYSIVSERDLHGAARKLEAYLDARRAQFGHNLGIIRAEQWLESERSLPSR